MVRGEQGRQVAGLRGLAETSTQLRYPWPLPEDREPPEEARPDAPRARRPAEPRGPRRRGGRRLPDALELVGNQAERAFLARRSAACEP